MANLVWCTSSIVKILSHPSVYFVGTPEEIGHHASPMLDQLAPFNPQIVTPDAIIETAEPGDLAVFYSEHFERFRHAIGVLKSKSIATLYMIDGVLEWRNAWENRPDEIACPHTMRPVLCHKVACIGENQARTIQRWGNQGKIEIVGIPRLDRYRNATNDLTDGVTQPRNLQSRSDTTQSTKILVITAKTPAFTDQQRLTVEQSLTDLRDFVLQFDAPIELQWRLTAGLDQFLGVDNHTNELAGNELFQQLQQVDAVIATPSTAILESMLTGLPTAVLNYHVCPTYMDSAWQINGPSQIEPIIHELIVPPAAKLHHQQQALHDTLYHQSSASDRMVELMVGMIEVAQKQIEQNQPLDFSQSILSLPASICVELQHDQLYPEDPCFKIDDVLELQARLSNALRHIEHQNDAIGVLERELAEAHDIFRQINSHPLAGPILKLRQRILNALSPDSRKD